MFAIVIIQTFLGCLTHIIDFHSVSQSVISWVRLNDGPDMKLFILVGLGRSFFVCCLAQRGSTVDSEINHKRHFIKIPFINKGIEFIDLPSIFKDRSVTSSIPAYFQNSEPQIICYKYNKPIRNTVFNFNKLVSDLDIHANTPES